MNRQPRSISCRKYASDEMASQFTLVQRILLFAADDVAVDEEVYERGLEHLGVNVVEHVLHHRVVRVGGVEARLADGAALALELPGAKRVRSVEEPRQVLDRVLLR